MPIKIEILADTPAELMIQLTGLLAGSVPYTPQNAKELGASQEMVAAVRQGMDVDYPVVTMTDKLKEDQEKINKAPAAKPPAKATKKSNGKSKVKPLPADVDPLAASEEDSEEDAAEPEDDPFADQEATTPEQMIKLATDKLRDIFSHAKGSAGVRALKEKYAVGFFHQVPHARAQEFLDDALRLEKEIAA